MVIFVVGPAFWEVCRHIKDTHALFFGMGKLLYFTTVACEWLSICMFIYV